MEVESADYQEVYSNAVLTRNSFQATAFFFIQRNSKTQDFPKTPLKSRLRS